MAQAISLTNFDSALLATAIFEETNRSRAANQLPPLVRLPELDSAADEQATHMALILRAEHGNPIPGEHTVVERVARTGLEASRVAENALMMAARRPVGAPERDYTYAALATSMVQRWMDSPGHRANLLDRRFTRVGCGARIAHGVPGDDRVFAAQVFFLPAAAAAAKE